jgi:3-phosphoshikimate 1-carboxyvinyltransferase
MDKTINPTRNLKGTIRVPGDSPISHRAAFLSALCTGPVEITNYSTGLESQSALTCLQQLGLEIESRPEENKTIINGKGLAGIIQPTEPIDVKTSVIAARMICGVLGSCDFESEVVCDEMIANLPMRRVIEPLEQMGAKIESTNYRFPLKVKGGKLAGIRYAMPVSSSQVKGAMLIAGLVADGATEIIERIPSRDHFERLLAYFGIKIKKSRVEPKPSNEDPLTKRFKKAAGIVSPDIKGDMISIRGGQKLVQKPIIIPGDLSAASYWIIAGLLVDGSEIKVEDVGLNPTRLGFVEVLKKMKAPIIVRQNGEYGFEPYGAIEIKSSPIKGRRMVGELIPTIIDELPVMAIVAAAAQGTSVIRDAYELRHQKTDRIKTIAANLRKMGVKVGELEDGLAIDGGTELEGAEIETFGDHRIAMSFAIAALIAKTPSVIKDAECVEVSYPGFWDDFDKLVNGELRS